MRTRLAGVVLTVAVASGGAVALAQDVDAQPVDADRTQQREERLQNLIDEGVITPERADEIRERMAERAAHRAERRAARSERLTELADTLGTTAEDLRADLRAGASLAELATAAGVDVDTVIDQIEARITDRIEQAVTDGRIDQAAADQRLDGLRERITDRVNGERPGRGEGRRGFGRGHRGPGG